MFQIIYIFFNVYNSMCSDICFNIFHMNTNNQCLCFNHVCTMFTFQESIFVDNVEKIRHLFLFLFVDSSCQYCCLTAVFIFLPIPVPQSKVAKFHSYQLLVVGMRGSVCKSDFTKNDQTILNNVTVQLSLSFALQAIRLSQET